MKLQTTQDLSASVSPLFWSFLIDQERRQLNREDLGELVWLVKLDLPVREAKQVKREAKVKMGLLVELAR